MFLETENGRQRKDRNTNFKNCLLRHTFSRQYRIFVISRFCFAEDDKEMYQELAQPLHCLLKLFVYRTSRSRLRRGFLKLPIITSKSQ